MTHVDSLSHFFWEGKTYNGFPAHMVSTSMGATFGSVEEAKTGMITRGVLVDVPMVRNIDWVERGEGVMRDDILAAEERCGFKVEEGDILLVRTGNYRKRLEQGPVSGTEPKTACQVACAPWFKERGIAMLGTDTSNDVRPSHYATITSPLHTMCLVTLGLWLIDNANLEQLAEACQQRNRYEFMLTLAPLRLRNVTGSPVNPIALF